jgi:hypothetical protein
MRLVASDFHLIRGGPTEPCDRAKVRRLRETALQRRVEEVLLAGDIADVTRGGEDILDTVAAVLGEELGEVFGAFGIRTTWILGNHDPVAKRMGRLTRALYRSGFRAGLFQVSSGPEYRGPWQIEHGHRFDPTCAGGALTTVGEVFTRLDGVLDHVGVNLDRVNPADWQPGPGEDAILDRPMHRAACRWAAAEGARLVTGHSHRAHDIGGRWRGREWRVLNCGAYTRSAPFSFAWILDTGEGGVECEWQEGGV